MNVTASSELVDHLVDFHEEIAESYEGWASGLHGKVAAGLVRFAAPLAGERALDVGTGTGLVAALLAEAVGPEGTVVGIDLSEGMLELARSRSLPNASFFAMAAEELLFKAGSFDLVTMGESLDYLLHPAQGLREAYRVLAPGGRIAVSCRRRSLNTEAQELFFASLGALAQRHYLKVPRYSDERGDFGEREVLPRMLEKAGFEAPRLTEFVTGGRAANAREWTELMTGTGPLPHTLISVLGPSPREEYEGELDGEMRRLGEEAYRYHFAYLFVVATRGEAELRN